METIRQLYKETEQFAAQQIQIAGWIRTNRNSKNFGFLEINDGSFFKNVQVVYSDALSNFEEIVKFSISSSLQICGILVETPDAKQPFEIQATEVVLLGNGDKEYPLQKKRHTFEYLRTIAHLRSRSNTFSAVFRVRSVLAYAIHKFFNERDFVYVHTPIITGSDCEGAGEMFRVTTLDMAQLPLTEEGAVDYAKDFFGKETSLTVSGQLAGETQAMAFRNIYTFGPTFRAEKSYTPRHAAEFWMVEPEIAFADIYDDMQLAEDMMKYVISYVLEECPEEMEFFNSFVDKGLLERLQNVLEADFVRITYTEAIEILEKSGKEFEYKPVWGVELQTEHERYLTEEVYKGPVIVRDYPKDVKAFYMRVNEDQKTVAAMDVLVPGVGELIGGSQREERLDVLEKRIEEMGLHKEDYWWYLDLRRYGTAKHAGFGLGFERAVMYLTGMTNIRDVIPFPRTTKSAEF